jgi:hypothetical protein
LRVSFASVLSGGINIMLKSKASVRPNRTFAKAQSAALLLTFATTFMAGAYAQDDATTKDQIRAQIDPSPTATGPANWTLIGSLVTTTPRPFKGSEGKVHLLYELVLTNFNRETVALDSVAIADADSPDKIVTTLSDKTLESAALNIGSSGKGTKVGPTQSKIIFVNIDVDKESDIPARLTHQIRYHALSGKDQASKTQYTPALTVSTKKAVTISSPLRGKGWFAAGGYASMIGHRRSLFPLDNKLQCAQRFAIDWVQISDDGYSTKQDVKNLDNSTCFKKTIHSVADGVVVGVVNQYDSQPVQVPSGDRYHPGGNSITIKNDDSYYAFYAHILKDSAKVKAGDRVKRGDAIALLGNSGNSTGPHLHFHLTDGPAPLAADGIPYVFDHFSVTGKVDDIDTFFKNDEVGKKQTIGQDSQPGQHTGELIREGAVVEFVD